MYPNEYFQVCVCTFFRLLKMLLRISAHSVFTCSSTCGGELFFPHFVMCIEGRKKELSTKKKQNWLLLLLLPPTPDTVVGRETFPSSGSPITFFLLLGLQFFLLEFFPHRAYAVAVVIASRATTTTFGVQKTLFFSFFRGGKSSPGSLCIFLCSFCVLIFFHYRHFALPKLSLCFTSARMCHIAGKRH